MEEEWRDVVGYEGLYQVSNFGRVRRMWTNHERIVRQSRIGRIHLNGGYRSVCLCKGNIAKSFRVHRLVAMAFIPNPDNLPQVNHKDENPANNRVENLEWCDARYNDNYGTRNARLSNSNSLSVAQYTLDGEFVRIWQSMAEAEKHGFDRSCICDCCKGRRHHHRGFVWRYA